VLSHVDQSSRVRTGGEFEVSAGQLVFVSLRLMQFGIRRRAPDQLRDWRGHRQRPIQRNSDWHCLKVRSSAVVFAAVGPVGRSRSSGLVENEKPRRFYPALEDIALTYLTGTRPWPLPCWRRRGAADRGALVLQEPGLEAGCILGLLSRPRLAGPKGVAGDRLFPGAGFMGRRCGVEVMLAGRGGGVGCGSAGTSCW